MPTLRGLTLDDTTAHAALLAAAEQVDRTGEHESAEDLAEQYANPDIELGKDVVGAVEGDELVGYFMSVPRVAPGSHVTIHLWATVRPDHRGTGVGTLLAGAMLERARQLHGERAPELPASIGISGVTDNDAQRELLATVGLLPHRWTFVMRADLSAVSRPAPGLPAGLTLRTPTDDDAERWRTVHNEVFRDHPGFTPWDDAMWTQFVTGSRSFRPELSLLLVHDDDPTRIEGYIQTNEYDAYREATGRREAYVAKVGVRRELRGRGVAGALLGEALRRYRAAGFDEAALDVDSENPTGANGVYLRAGFAVERRLTDYALDLPPLT